MNVTRRSIALLAMAPLAAFGIAMAQQEADRLDLDELAQRLELTSEVRTQVAPEIERLNELHARLADEWQRHQQLRTEFREARAKIEEVLTPEQRTRFRMLLRDTYRVGPHGAMGTTHMRSGHRGAGHMGPGHMGADHRMGNGPGTGMMGPGTCDGMGPHGPARQEQP